VLAQSLAPELTPETPVVREQQAEAILARSLAAIGGAEARAEITSSRSVGQLETPIGDTQFELLRAHGENSNQFLLRHEIKDLGRMEMGCDGAAAWRSDPLTNEVQPLSVAQATESLRAFDMQSLLRELDLRFASAIVADAVTIDETLCDVVTLSNGAEETVHVAFDRTTGLPRSLDLGPAVPSGPSRRIVIEAWSETPQPLRFARTIRIEHDRQTMRATYRSVSFDDVSEVTFTAPDKQQ
jgi:hypothetical protein